MIMEKDCVFVILVSLLLDINVYAKEFHLKTSVIDVHTDQTLNTTLEFVDATKDTLYKELNVFEI